jgi:cytochrome P450
MHQTASHAVVYFGELIEQRRRDPGDDLVSELVAIGDQDPELLPADLLATVEILLIAGFETAVNMIGNGVLALMRHPAVRDWMLAEPDRCADVDWFDPARPNNREHLDG